MAAAVQKLSAAEAHRVICKVAETSGAMRALVLDAVKAEAALACSITFDAIFSLSPTTNRSFATEEERKRGKNIAVKKYNERPNNNWRKHTEGQIFKVFVRVFYFFPPFLRNLQIQLFAIRL